MPPFRASVAEGRPGDGAAPSPPGTRRPWPAPAPVRRLLGPLCLLGALVLAAAGPPPGAPNVVVLVADGLGWGDLGSYGQESFRTERLDRMASEGMRLTRFYAGSPRPAASRASLLTGRPLDRDLEAGDATLAALARSKGYRTLALGLWGLGGPGSGGIPTVQGFDEWFGYLEEEELRSHYARDRLWRNEEPVSFPGEPYAPYLFTRAATNFVALNRSSPFFLYYAASLPRPPLESPTTRPYSRKEWPEPQKLLAAMIHRLDRELGAILDSLEEHGLERRTAVFFASSSGPSPAGGADPAFFASTGGLRGAGGSLHEGGLRVPLLARWPGRIAPGTASARPVSTIDLHATIAEILGGGSPGLSFLPELTGGRQRAPLPLVWSGPGPGGLQRAILDGNWKGVQSAPGAPLELFRLDRDPAESRDLSSRYSRTARRLERRLDSRLPAP